jgi:hypothetical protein
MHDAQLRTLLSRPSLKKRPFPWQTCPSYVRELLTGLKILFRIGVLYNNKEMKQITKKKYDDPTIPFIA